MTCYRTPNKIGHALRGLHGAADPGNWPYDEEAFSIYTRSKMQAVKVLTGGDLNRDTIRRFKAMGLFVCARVMGSIYQGEVKTGKQFVQAEEHSIAMLCEEGVNYFEIHNEPNLHSTPDPNSGPKEGFGVMWGKEGSTRPPGEEYADWWLDAVDYLTPRYPKARWGFPGMSPGDAIPNLRYSGKDMLKQADKAVKKADWQAVHVYWDNLSSWWMPAVQQVNEFALGTNKLVMVTEFSNPSTTPKAAKGIEYAGFYNESQSKLPANVAAVFCYVLSSSSGFETETWRNSPIPDIVGELTNP